MQTIRESRYKPAAFHVEWVRVDQPVPMAPWRAVGATQNGYFLECFIDEVARAAGRDPYELRRELLAHDARALNVIDTVAKAAAWGQSLPMGRARGMAFVECYGSLCAEVGEVSLRAGRSVVHRVVCALDCGSVVLPDGVRSQVEGGIVQGLSAVRGEAVGIAAGGAQERNFDTYPLLRISKMLMLQLNWQDISYVIDVRTTDISFLEPYLESILVVGQNLKFDYKYLKFYGIELDRIYDTMLAEACLTNGFEVRSLGLAHLAEKYCNIKLNKSVCGQFSYLEGEPFTDQQITYGVGDVTCLTEIKTKQLV